MALDEAALVAELDSNALYVAALVAGSTGGLLVLLHAPDPALPKRYHGISRQDFIDATAAEYATLSVALRQQIDSYLQTDSQIPVHKPGVQAWVNNNLPASKAAIVALAQQDGRPCDAFFDDVDDTNISKAQVRSAMRQVTKCQMHPTAQAAVQADKKPKRDAAQARRVSILSQWQGEGRPVRPEFVDFYPLPKNPTGQAITERHTRLEGRELIERYRESVAASPL